VPARLAVLASGTGTTLQAILDAVAAGTLDASVVVVGSDRSDAPALRRAQDAGVETFAVPFADYHDRDRWNRDVEQALGQHGPDLVVLAGFMRILDPGLVRRFRMINTHPSLLPCFPGAHAVRDALAYGVKVSGVTVHRVDEGVDTGPILAQAAVPVRDGDTVDTLQARIQAAEKPLYLDTIRQVCKEF
jgi:phosphoribosylglycinamide formyltransferase 1